MSAGSGGRLDVEQLLAETWNDRLARHIADRVAAPGGCGHLVRAAQPDATDDQILYVLQQVGEVLAEETGVDLDHARRPDVWVAVDDVMCRLVHRWRDGGSLWHVGAHHDRLATAALQRLTPKAAEWAGCHLHHDQAVPLRVDGRLLIDVTGLLHYRDTFAGYGLAAHELDAIRVLLQLERASRPT